MKRDQEKKKTCWSRYWNNRYTKISTFLEERQRQNTISMALMSLIKEQNTSAGLRTVRHI